MSSFPALFYVSGSPQRTGQRDCNFRRWLSTHAGAHGTGWRRKSTAVPLATGKSVHKGIELLGGWLLDWQTSHPNRRLLELPREVIAWGATEAASRYEATARAKGLLVTLGDDTAAASRESLILEQRTLVEALIWIWATVRLPIILGSYRILNVECEDGFVLNCTCGLGEYVGDETNHRLRGCCGIMQQTRSDLLLESWSDRTLAYEETKTKAQERKSWEDEWEHSGQLLVNMEAASRRLGRSIAQAFVTCLFKGWRGRDKGDPPTAPKYQHTPLAWPWFDPGSPPMREANWSSQYKWRDDYGKGHTLPHTYQRQALWNEELPLATSRPGASRVESFIAGYITPMMYVDYVKVLGPFPRPARRVPQAIEGLRALETRWQADVAWLRERAIYGPDDTAASDGARAEHVIDRSWNCTGYDGTPCEFRPICDQQAGWQDPGNMGIYEFRRPHHEPERAAFEACGVVFPADEEGEESDGDDN